MCKPRNRKQRKPRKARSLKKTQYLRALLSAAAALPSFAVPSGVAAQSVAESSQFRFQYAYYQDRQEGEKRIKVKAPMAWTLVPLGDSTELEASAVLDSVSGASPLYHDTLSGASGVGIEDERFAGDIKVTEYFEDFSIGVGTTYSNEDDYRSVGGSVEARFWNENKSTVYAIGFGGSSDDVSSTNEPLLDESNHTFDGLLGVTQVINKNSLLQCNFTYATSNGYLSDPYKAADRRPDTRDKFAFLTRYVLFVPELEGSLHVDYRFFTDSWSVNSHTVDTMWYQPLGEVWTLRPHVRLYSQSKADFYSNVFPPSSSLGHYSADQRLSGFGELTTGLKVIRDFGEGFSLSANLEFIHQRGEWSVFTKGSPGLEEFTEAFFTFGISKVF
ncbi:MAG: DUF3570 domain-containing protein [Bdellovibrionales bacterium]|nr:DUF3570 domain-containing protein [Bdellovibrionales bacterium]